MLLDFEGVVVGSETSPTLGETASGLQAEDVSSGSIRRLHSTLRTDTQCSLYKNLHLNSKSIKIDYNYLCPYAYEDCYI
jgi:hypothetical protein